MTISLSAELEQFIRKRADERHTTPEAIVIEALGELFSESFDERSLQLQTPSDWSVILDSLAIHCGVSLNDEAVSSEGLYD
jgi:hypothetical protein